MVPDPDERDAEEWSDEPSDEPAGSGDAGGPGGGGDDPDGGNGDGGGGGDDGDDGGDEKWYGVATLSSTKDATVDLLWPPEVGVWLRLAVIALFVGGAGGAPTSGFNTGGTGGPDGGSGDVPPLPDVPVSGETIVALVVALVAALVVLALLFAVVGAVMEFVLVESLRTREVRIRPRFRSFFRRGLRLFGFRLVVGLVAVAAVAVPLLLVFGLGVAVSPLLFLLAFPVLLLFGVGGLLVWAVMRLTTDFVVPAMLAEGHGVLDGWRRVWPVVREEWKQVGVYLLVRVGIGIGAGIAASIATLLVALVVAIPFAIVAALVVVAAGFSTAGVAVLGVLGALFVLALVAVAQVVQVVPMTFLRYYSLAVLGHLDADLDLVPWFGGETVGA